MCSSCFRAIVWGHTTQKTVAEGRSGVIFQVFGFWDAAYDAEGICISEGGNQEIEF